VELELEVELAVFGAVVVVEVKDRFLRFQECWSKRLAMI
jgi:hypothetical protein